MIRRLRRIFMALALCTAFTGTAFAQHSAYFKPFSYGGVSFSYGSSLASSITASRGKLYVNLGSKTVPDLAFQFNGYIALPPHPYQLPEMLIFNPNDPVFHGLTGLDMRPDIQALRTLLHNRPALDRLSYIPYVLIREDEAELVIARPHYIRFQNGWGVGFLSALSMPVAPISNNTPVLWIFRGLTDDGRSLIAINLPVRVPGLQTLAGPPASRSPEQLYKNWKPYAARVQAYLNRLPDRAFVPYPSNLDRLAKSLSVHPASY